MLLRFLRAPASLLLFSTNYHYKSTQKNESEEITRQRKEGQIYIKKRKFEGKKAGAFTCTAGTKVKKPANKTVISVRRFFTIYQPSLLSPAKWKNKLKLWMTDKHTHTHTQGYYLIHMRQAACILLGSAVYRTFVSDLCLLLEEKIKDRTDHKFTMFLFTNEIAFSFANPGSIIEDYMSNINFEIASATVTIQFQRFAVLFLIENSDFFLFPSFWLKKYGNIIISWLTSHVLHLEPFMVFHKEFEIQECIKSIIKSWM